MVRKYPNTNTYMHEKGSKEPYTFLDMQVIIVTSGFLNRKLFSEPFCTRQEFLNLA